MKKVRSTDQIVLGTSEAPVILPKGAVFQVELVLPDRIVLFSEDKEYYELDLDTFEGGFEALG